MGTKFRIQQNLTERKFRFWKLLLGISISQGYSFFPCENCKSRKLNGLSDETLGSSIGKLKFWIYTETDPRMKATRAFWVKRSKSKSQLFEFLRKVWTNQMVLWSCATPPFEFGCNLVAGFSGNLYENLSWPELQKIKASLLFKEILTENRAILACLINQVLLILLYINNEPEWPKSDKGIKSSGVSRQVTEGVSKISAVKFLGYFHFLPKGVPYWNFENHTLYSTEAPTKMNWLSIMLLCSFKFIELLLGCTLLAFGDMFKSYFYSKYWHLHLSFEVSVFFSAVRLFSQKLFVSLEKPPLMHFQSKNLSQFLARCDV